MQARFSRSSQQRWPHSQPRWVYALKRRSPLLLATGCAFAGAAGFLSSLAYVAEDRGIHLPNDPAPRFAAVTAEPAESPGPSEVAARVPASLFDADLGLETANDTGALAAALQPQDATETGPDAPPITAPEASAAGEVGAVVPVFESGDATATPAPEVTPTETPAAATLAPAAHVATPLATPGGSHRTSRHTETSTAPSGEVVDPRALVVEDLLEQVPRPIAQVLVAPVPRPR